MRMSHWSSDLCSSYLGERLLADCCYADARRRLREAAVLFEQVGARSWLTRIDGALATMADDPTSAGASPASAASVHGPDPSATSDDAAHVSARTGTAAGRERVCLYVSVPVVASE